MSCSSACRSSGSDCRNLILARARSRTAWLIRQAVRNRSAPPRRRWASVWARRASGDVSNGTSEVYLSGRLSSCPPAAADQRIGHRTRILPPRSVLDCFSGPGAGGCAVWRERHLQTRHSLSGSSAPGYLRPRARRSRKAGPADLAQESSQEPLSGRPRSPSKPHPQAGSPTPASRGPLPLRSLAPHFPGPGRLLQLRGSSGRRPAHALFVGHAARERGDLLAFLAPLISPCASCASTASTPAT